MEALRKEYESLLLRHQGPTPMSKEEMDRLKMLKLYLDQEIPAEKKNTGLTDKFTKTAMNDAALKRKESESLRCQDPTRMSNKDNMWKLRRDQGSSSASITPTKEYQGNFNNFIKTGKSEAEKNKARRTMKD